MLKLDGPAQATARNYIFRINGITIEDAADAIIKAISPSQIKALRVADSGTVHYFHAGRKTVMRGGMGPAMHHLLDEHMLVTSRRPAGSLGGSYQVALTRLGKMVLAALDAPKTFTSADGRTHDIKTGRYVKKSS